jgi:hypothetical protein
MHIDRRARSILDSHVSEGPDDELLTTVQVAEWFGCSTQWLEIARHKSTGPRFEKMSNQMIKYRRESVRKWLRQREHQGTAEYRRRAT